MVASTVTTIASGRLIARTGRYKVFPVIGLALMTLGLLLLSTMDAATSRTRASLFMVVFGLGFGLVSQVLVLAIQNSVDRRDLGVATASANFFRALGGSIGVATFGAVFTAHVVGPVDASRLQSGPGQIRNLPPTVRDRVVEAVAHSIHTVFLVATPIAALGLLVVLFLREYPLRGPERKSPQRALPEPSRS